MPKHDHHEDEIFMQRAMELAMLGLGSVSPNPIVGCVIVYNGRIIGEGWHQKYGGPHAEVNAIDNVSDKSLLQESTLYVTLEPCSHFGKTPPCCDLLIAQRVKKVVVANIDTNPVVNEAGIHKLRAAGIVVITGILEKECRQLNRRFFTFVEKKRPHIILKWAETADGFVARKNFSSKWISDEFSRQMVHKMRAETDAVLVGRNTAQFDNPELSVRDWSGRNPVRVIIDRFLKLSESLKIFDGTQPTLVYNVLKHEERQGTSLIRIDEDDFILKLVSDLYKRNIQSLMVEGGAQTLQAFISAGLWDEAFVFVSPQNFGEGIASPKISGLVTSQGKIKNDWVKIIHNNAAAMHTIS